MFFRGSLALFTVTLCFYSLTFRTSSEKFTTQFSLTY